MRDWKLPIFLSIVALGVFSAFYDTSIPPQQAGNTAPESTAHAPETAPSVTFLSPDGTTRLPLDSLRGKAVLLNFWASWCEPCAREFPVFMSLAREFPKKLAVVAVSADEDKANIPRFLGRYSKIPPNLHVMWDKDKKLSQEVFQTVRLPETILITPEGRMARKLVGAESVKEDTLREWIAASTRKDASHQR